MSVTECNKGVRFKIADTCFEVISSDQRFQRDMALRYKGFASDQDADLVIKLIFFPFCFGRSDGKADVVRFASDPKSRSVTIYVVESECADRTALLNIILHFVFRQANNVLGSDRFLMHAGGTVYDGRGIIFTGPSGIGKTTMCKMLSDSNIGAVVLSDEKIAVSKSETGFRVHSTPLGGELVINEDLSAPLQAVFFLKQALEPKIRPMEVSESLEALKGQLTPHIIFSGLDHRMDNEATLISELVRKVRCFELSFRRDLSFWPYVESVVSVQERGVRGYECIAG